MDVNHEDRSYCPTGVLESGRRFFGSNYDGCISCFSTPLKAASSQGNKAMVELLLEAGADANDADINGHTPLLEAATYGDKEVAEVLLNYGAEPNVADSEGFTPLYKAAGAFSTSMVQLLLERGALVDGASVNGWTPLRKAAFLGDRDVVKVLLDNGADPFKTFKKDDVLGRNCFSAAWMPEVKQMLIAATVSRARNQIMIRQSNGTRTQPYTIRVLHKRQI